MKCIQYRYLTAEGEEIIEESDSASMDSIAELVRSTGGFLIEANYKTEGKVKIRIPIIGAFGKLSIDEQIRFLEQMALMLKSGMTISGTLDILTKQRPGSKISTIATRVLGRISDGRSMTEVFGELKVFPQAVIGLINLAEVTGESVHCFEQAALYLNQKKELRSTVITALSYPAIMILMTIGVVWYLVFKVIPKIQHFLQSRNIAMPRSTQILINLTNWLNDNWLHMFIGIICLITVLGLVYSTNTGKRVSHILLMRFPVFGNFVLNASLSSISWVLSTLLSSGQSLIVALETTSQTIWNKQYSFLLTEVSKDIMHGHASFSDSLKARRFPMLLAECAKVGENTGELDIVLISLSNYFKRQMHYQLKIMSSLFEPIMLIIIGGIIGFVYYSFFQVVFSTAMGNG